MAKKKKRAVPPYCRMAKSMTKAHYLNATMMLFNGINNFWILVQDIMCIESVEGKSLFRMRGGITHLQKHNIGYYCERLSCSQFGKYGKAAIINKNYAAGLITGRTIVVVLTDGWKIVNSEHENQRLKQDLKPFIKKNRNK